MRRRHHRRQLYSSSIEQARQLTHKLFAGAGLFAQTPEQSARQLLTALAQLGGALASFELSAALLARGNGRRI